MVVHGRRFLGVGVDNASAHALDPCARGKQLLRLWNDVLIEEIDELRLLGSGRVLNVVGD
jgi:hypothetical protein